MATAVTMTGLEFDALPFEQGRDLELLDGELIQMPSPTMEHQGIVFNIQLALKQHLKGQAAAVSQGRGIRTCT
jgi:Uma2 family endonuclease